MPDPLTKILDDILFWPRSKLPTAPQMLVLEHLASAGEPRLYLYGYQNGYLRAGVSNSASAPGFDVRCDVDPFFNQWCNPPQKWWVDIDPKLNGDRDARHGVYQINPVGRHVIEWAHSQGRYGAKTPPSPQALENMRRKKEAEDNE